MRMTCMTCLLGLARGLGTWWWGLGMIVPCLRVGVGVGVGARVVA